MDKIVLMDVLVAVTEALANNGDTETTIPQVVGDWLTTQLTQHPEPDVARWAIGELALVDIGGGTNEINPDTHTDFVDPGISDADC